MKPTEHAKQTARGKKTARVKQSAREQAIHVKGRAAHAKDRAARTRGPAEVAEVTAAELRALQRELARRMPKPGGSRARSTRATPLRWNPEPEDVQKSVAQLVLTLVEFLRQLMERQAIRRMEAETLTQAEVEAVGQALMLLEQTVRDIGARFGLTPEDLNLDLGPIRLI